MAWLKGSLSVCFLLANTVVVCTPLFLMALVRLPLSGAPRRALTRYMDLAIDGWVSGNRLLMRLLGLVDLRIDWPTETLSRDKWYAVVCNHQSWVDILLLQDCFRSATPPLKFFTKRELIWLPLVGLGMHVLGFPYVRRADNAQLAANPALKKANRDSTLAACAVFRNHPTAVLIFLEGTRFTDAKRIARNSRFEHLLNPRTGGLGYVLSGLGDEVAQLIDVTIAYSGPPPSFWEFLSGRCPAAQMSVRTINLDPAMQSEESKTQRRALQPLVERLWRIKDSRLHRNKNQ